MRLYATMIVFFVIPEEKNRSMNFFCISHGHVSDVYVFLYHFCHVERSSPNLSHLNRTKRPQQCIEQQTNCIPNILNQLNMNILFDVLILLLFG